MGSHWWHIAELKGSSKIECFKIMFEWTNWWWVADIQRYSILSINPLYMSSIESRDIQCANWANFKCS